MSRSGQSSSAQRTCAQCKASKKKCDKLLPVCSRCTRLSVACVYPESDKPAEFDTGYDRRGSRFDEVYRRLERIEARVFPRAELEGGSTAADIPIRSPSATEESAPPVPTAISAATLRPQYLNLALWGSIVRSLESQKTTVKDVVGKYFEHTHQWLPMIPKERFEKEQRERQETVIFANESIDGWLLLFYTMHLLVTPACDISPAEPIPQSSWYRTCKYHFAQHVALSEPSIQLIQAGMLLALFEHLQCVGRRALITLGICARLAYDLELDDIVLQQSSRGPGEMTTEEEEIVLTWWGLNRLERYFNMPPLERPQQTSLPYQAYNESMDKGISLLGPPMAGFRSFETDSVEWSIFELEAARKLGQVQALVREDRQTMVISSLKAAQRMIKESTEYLTMLNLNRRGTGSCAGIAVTLSAGLQIQCFHATKQNSLDQDAMLTIHTYIEQLANVFWKCRQSHGFSIDFYEGLQPSWISIAYQALDAYKMLRSRDDLSLLPNIETHCFADLLQGMSSRWKLAERCMELLQR